MKTYVPSRFTTLVTAVLLGLLLVPHMAQAWQTKLYNNRGFEFA